MEVNPNTNDPTYWAFNYRLIAVNFRQSAEQLLPTLDRDDEGTPTKLTAVPYYFLVSHAIELFLKSALLKRGYKPKDLKKFQVRHNLAELL